METRIGGCVELRQASCKPSSIDRTRRFRPTLCKSRYKLLHPSYALSLCVVVPERGGIPPYKIITVLKAPPFLLSKEITERGVTEGDRLETGERVSQGVISQILTHFVCTHLHLKDRTMSTPEEPKTARRTRSLTSRMVKSYPLIDDWRRLCASARNTASHCASFGPSIGHVVPFASLHCHRFQLG